ncbi:MAG: RHS repeat-associated core domain-containing protein [Spirochaetaceae bacterium]|nr:MAG: RHS repeat-associated core domain-containing protein [Spirochaetaceae bacterium]
MVLEQLAGVSEVRYGYDARGRVVAVERDYYGESDINRATSMRFAPQSESGERVGSIAGAYRHGSQSEAPPPGEPGRAFSLRHGEHGAEQPSDGEAPPEAPETSGPGSPTDRHRHRGNTPDFGPAGVANYAYDPLGRRVERSVAPQGARSQTSRNSYRGMGFSLAAVHQASGGPSVADLRRPGEGRSGGSVAAGRYTLSSVHIAVRGRTISEHSAPEGGSTLGEANVREARREVAGASLRSAPHGAAEQARYYHHDVRGSVRYISRPPARGNRGGAVTFDAFGLPADGLERFARDEADGLMLGGRADGHGPLAEGYGYTGKRLDPFLGGYDYGFRHYTPATGRFFTEDPIKDGSNWYAYVNNDPVNFVDPLGLDAVDVQAAADGETRDLAVDVVTAAAIPRMRLPDSTSTPADLVNELGAFGPPPPDGITAHGSRPRYDVQSVTLPIANMMLSDALTPDYGVASSVTTGSGLQGSLRLTTHRLLGQGNISNYELEKFERTGSLDNLGRETFGWEDVESESEARHLLEQNPELVREAIEESEAGPVRQFFENLLNTY